LTGPESDKGASDHVANSDASDRDDGGKDINGKQSNRCHQRLTPNGLVGFWLRVGLIDSAMNPTGFINDPTHIGTMTTADGDT